MTLHVPRPCGRLLVSEASQCWVMGNRLRETTSPRSMPLHRECVPGFPLAVL